MKHLSLSLAVRYALPVLCLSLVACDKTPNEAEVKAAVQTSGDGYVSPLPDNAPVVSVVTTGTVPPFSYQDEYGNMQGIDVDIVRAVGELEGFKVEFYKQPWQNVLPSIESGTRQLAMNGINYTIARDNAYGVTNAYYYNPSAFMYKADGKYNPKTLQNLSGLRVGVMQDSKQDIEASAVQGAQVVRYENMFGAYKGLAQDEVDVVAYDMPPMQFISKGHPELHVEITPYEAPSEKNTGAVMVVAKDNVDLLAKINSGIEKLRASGKLEAIQKKWVGDNLGNN